MAGVGGPLTVLVLVLVLVRTFPELCMGRFRGRVPTSVRMDPGLFRHI